MYRSMTGLGLLEWTGTGVKFVSTPTCVTQGELDEAFAKCPYHEIRGLGVQHGQRADAPMSGRLSAFSPCAIADLPVCPAPKCIDEYTAGLIAACIAGTQSNPDFDCTSLYTYALSQLPYCSRPGVLQPVPGCLSKDLIAARDYCSTYPAFNGPNKTMNAICWMAKHDQSYWAQMMAAQPCYTQAYVPPAPTPAAPPAYTPPAYTPPAYTPPAYTPPAYTPPAYTPPEKTEASMAGMWGILALLAAAGGGYYMYRRNKR